MRRMIKEGEPITENRRVIRIGSSFYLNLPPEFIILNRIKPGDKVPITCDHMLRVIPHVDRQVVEETESVQND